MNEGITWGCRWSVEKRAHKDAEPYELLIREGNILTYTGASSMWARLIGTTVDAFDNTNAHIGVGDGNTATSKDQTDLQGSNTLLVAMEATYPIHTPGNNAAAATIAYRSEFGATEANFAWNEWGIFNAAAAGEMLNRKVEALGTKTNPEVWTFTVTLTLS